MGQGALEGGWGSPLNVLGLARPCGAIREAARSLALGAQSCLALGVAKSAGNGGQRLCDAWYSLSPGQVQATGHVVNQSRHLLPRLCSPNPGHTCPEALQVHAVSPVEAGAMTLPGSREQLPVLASVEAERDGPKPPVSG